MCVPVGPAGAKAIGLDNGVANPVSHDATGGVAAIAEIHMPCTIRPEQRQDRTAIHALTQAAFLHAPHAAHTEHFIVDALRAAGALHLSLVAEDEGVLVGHVAVSPVCISSGAAGWYGLGPISVAPGRQRQGIGSALMRAALGQLTTAGAGGCVLAGNPHYYGRFGFVHQNHLVYPGLPAEFFLVHALAQTVPDGVVQFHAAFSARG